MISLRLFAGKVALFEWAEFLWLHLSHIQYSMGSIECFIKSERGHLIFQHLYKFLLCNLTILIMFVATLEKLQVVFFTV